MSSRRPDANLRQKQIYLVLTFKSDHSNESYFYVILVIMLDKVVVTLKSIVKTLVCDHSNESY